MVKLMIAVPFGGRYVPPEWAMGVASMDYPVGASRMMAITKGVKREKARTNLLKRALDSDVEYVLFLDDDTVPPPDAAIKLIRELDQRDDSYAVCAGIYTNKRTPTEPLVFSERGAGPYWKWSYGDVFECWGIATGCMLIRTSALRDLPEPWFRDVISLEDAAGDPIVIGDHKDISEIQMTDDIYFCERLRVSGFKVLAHGGVLPVHYNQRGQAYVLDPSTRPMRDVDPTTLWYAKTGIT